MATFEPSTVHGQINKYGPLVPLPIPSPDDNLELIGGGTDPTLMDIDIDPSRTPQSGGGAFSLQTSPHLDLPQHANHLLDSSTAIDSHEQPWRLLISGTISQDELPLLIGNIFSDGKATDLVDPLQASDAQALIDVIDRVRHCVPFLWKWLTYLMFDRLRSIARR